METPKLLYSVLVSAVVLGFQLQFFAPFEEFYRSL